MFFATPTVWKNGLKDHDYRLPRKTSASNNNAFVSLAIMLIIVVAHIQAFTPSLLFHSKSSSKAKVNPLFSSSTNSNTNSHNSGTTTPTPNTSTTNSPTLQSGYDTTDGYERFLYSKKQKMKNQRQDMSLRRKIIENDDDDGYENMMKKGKHRPLVQKMLLTPFKIGMKVTKMIWRDVPEPGTLILVRHGESEWNVNKTFTVRGGNKYGDTKC